MLLIYHVVKFSFIWHFPSTSLCWSYGIWILRTTISYCVQYLSLNQLITFNIFLLLRRFNYIWHWSQDRVKSFSLFFIELDSKQYKNSENHDEQYKITIITHIFVWYAATYINTSRIYAAPWRSRKLLYSPIPFTFLVSQCLFLFLLHFCMCRKLPFMLIYIDQHKNSPKIKYKENQSVFCVFSCRLSTFCWVTTVSFPFGFTHLFKCPFYEVVSKLSFQMSLIGDFSRFFFPSRLLVDFKSMLVHFVIILCVIWMP